VETFEPFLPNDQSGTVSECLGPRAEGTTFDELVKTVDEFWREGNRDGLSVTAHAPA